MHAVSALHGVIIIECRCGGMNSITVLMTDMDGTFADERHENRHMEVGWIGDELLSETQVS
jgi:hypothetical protein